MFIKTNFPTDDTNKICHSLVVLPSSNTVCKGKLNLAWKLAVRLYKDLMFLFYVNFFTFKRHI